MESISSIKQPNIINVSSLEPKHQAIVPEPTNDQSRDKQPPEVCNSFIKNMFAGRNINSELFPFPVVTSPAEKIVLSKMIQPLSEFFKEVRKKEEIHPGSTISELLKMGLLGSQMPVMFGGLGFSNSQFARLCELVGSFDLSIGVTLGAHQSIGYKGLAIYGSEEQKQKYLPRISNGDLCAFCLIEEECNAKKCDQMK